ncbi:uncharacterized protein LOC109371131 [Meleagris gallopavo]|uniref:uncharacterized protein LOC109371131 n=1 Tax=Meleagris gallopavo TaxID=9103 RepID=UPI00093D979D|nr:uncharacterized protein LOC109371131 [Meleagris gallopavo]
MGLRLLHCVRLAARPQVCAVRFHRSLRPRSSSTLCLLSCQLAQLWLFCANNPLHEAVVWEWPMAGRNEVTNMFTGFNTFPFVLSLVELLRPWRGSVLGRGAGWQLCTNAVPVLITLCGAKAAQPRGPLMHQAVLNLCGEAAHKNHATLRSVLTLLCSALVVFAAFPVNSFAAVRDVKAPSLLGPSRKKMLKPGVPAQPGSSLHLSLAGRALTRLFQPPWPLLHCFSSCFAQSSWQSVRSEVICGGQLQLRFPRCVCFPCADDLWLLVLWAEGRQFLQAQEGMQELICVLVRAALLWSWLRRSKWMISVNSSQLS